MITHTVNEAALISGKKGGTRPTKYFETENGRMCTGKCIYNQFPLKDCSVLK